LRSQTQSAGEVVDTVSQLYQQQFRSVVLEPEVSFSIYNPGDNDPAIGLKLYESLFEAASQGQPHSTDRHFLTMAADLSKNAWKYVRHLCSNRVNWWDHHLNMAAGLTLPRSGT